MPHAPWIFNFTFWTIDIAVSTLQNKKITCEDWHQDKI